MDSEISIVEDLEIVFRLQENHLKSFLVQHNFHPKRVFTEEISSDGQRRFHVVDASKFWNLYEKSESKHFYEVILQHEACRLYFDLEFMKNENPGINSDEILEEFIVFVNQFVFDQFEVRISKNHWLILDSSTDAKFSCHAIVHFPGNLLFSSNLAMQEFIKQLETSMIEKHIGMVKKDVKIRKNGEIIKKLSEVVIFDNQVYSKNQQFRLFLSSKAGKDAVLKLYKNCNFYGTIQDNETIFFDSLVVLNDYYKFPRLQASFFPQIYKL